MLANALFHIFVVLFVTGFIAIAALGHVLLIAAIWPGPFTSRPEPRRDDIPSAGHSLQQR